MLKHIFLLILLVLVLFIPNTAHAITIRYTDTWDLIKQIAMYTGFGLAITFVASFAMGLIQKFFAYMRRESEEEAVFIVRKQEEASENSNENNVKSDTISTENNDSDSNIESKNEEDEVLSRILTETYTFYESGLFVSLIARNKIKLPFLTISPEGFCFYGTNKFIPWRMLEDVKISELRVNRFIKQHTIITYIFTDELIQKHEEYATYGNKYVRMDKLNSKKRAIIQVIADVRKPATMEIFAQILILFWRHYK